MHSSMSVDERGKHGQIVRFAVIIDALLLPKHIRQDLPLSKHTRTQPILTGVQPSSACLCKQSDLTHSEARPPAAVSRSHSFLSSDRLVCAGASR